MRARWDELQKSVPDGLVTRAQFGIGAVFSSPLVVDGVVYFGSTEGNLYAVE